MYLPLTKLWNRTIDIKIWNKTKLIIIHNKEHGNLEFIIDVCNFLYVPHHYTSRKHATQKGCLAHEALCTVIYISPSGISTPRSSAVAHSIFPWCTPFLLKSLITVNEGKGSLPWRQWCQTGRPVWRLQEVSRDPDFIICWHHISIFVVHWWAPKAQPLILRCGRKEGQTGREYNHFLRESGYLLQSCSEFTVRLISVDI